MSGSKEKKGSGKTWKRQAREVGKVQPVGQLNLSVQKRNLEYVDMEVENEDGAGKRPKQDPVS